MFGPFTIRVSDQAEPLDYTAIPEEVRSVLCQHRSYNPDTHDIYQFFVIPEFQFQSQRDRLSRKLKKQSYDKADRALVHAEPGNRDIRFLGMFPATEHEEGQLDLDLEGEALFEVTIPKLFRTRLRGAAKSHVRRKSRHTVLAARTDDLVQWIFLKSWVQSGREIGMKVVCSVPKELALEERHVLCSAKFSEGNRTIEAIHRRRVAMPFLATT